MAKEAIKTGEFLDIPIPFSDLKEKYKFKYKNRHFMWLENFDIYKGVYYFSNFLSKNMRTWFKHITYSKLHTSIIIRLRKNHHSFQESLYRKNLVDDPYCIHCNSNEETLDHFLWECPSFQSQRNWLIEKLTKNNFPTPFNSINLINNPKSIFTKILLKFITVKCKRNI